jgi:hypothetical protein
LLPETVPVEGELDLEELAKNFPLAGGYIKNAVFKAAFRAASANRGLSQQDLERAASEELATLESNRQPIGFGGD